MKRVRLPLPDAKWLSPFQPQRSDPDLRPVPLGFLAIIAVGTALLLLPFSHLPGRPLHWINAFFLATSATCVNGLSPINVAETLSGFGQGVLLALVQAGGLGIITASLALVMLSGERLSLAHEGAVTATIGRLQRARPAELFRFSCLVIALMEAAGATSLYWRLQTQNPAADPLGLIWQAVFYSVNAFCNAGFSIFPEGLARWRGDAALLGIVDLLVIAGGIGLLSLVNLRYYYFWRRDPRRRGRITLQTRLTVVVSALLIAAGTVATLLFEWGHTLAGQPWAQKLSWAAFHSVMTRTGGFNVVDVGQMHPATLLSSLVLMFIGGSPGSMAGGIKTVTVAILFCTARAALLRQETVQVFGRRIAPRMSGIALMIALLGLTVAATGIGALMLTELGQPSSAARGNWLGLAFEAVSAFGTVGLSTGVTGLLTISGKLVVIALIFTGRVGPLMLAVYLARPVKPWHVRYPEEDVALG
ncbi:MAG: potassium transporter TrkG [Opitutaceae bacterium]|nr:potassium transporter TrkG [Opitutaceae bacterium]